MRHINYISAFSLLLLLGFVGCDKADTPATGDDMQQIDGIVLGLGELAEATGDAELSARATTRATVNGVVYAVNTTEDPTRTKDAQNYITDRNSWKLDFDLFNGNVTTKYAPGSFEGKTSPTPNPDGSLNWKPTGGDLFFPNYFRPWAEVWLYHTTKNALIAMDQSVKATFLAQDQLHQPKSRLSLIAKRITLQLHHQRAMINFKFEDIVRADIEESTVKVRVGSTDGVGGTVYTPYNVRPTGVLEYMLILPESTPATSEIIVEYSTKGNTLQQPIQYVQDVTLISSGTLGSNNAYCFTLSSKEMRISPVTIINWVTGEPVSGEYVAVTAYPTFKGPANTVYYFYYDNKLTNDGTLGDTPKLQPINFNNDGECTIKPDGRVITHIFKNNMPTEDDWTTYKLGDPVILGGSDAKMYIDLTGIFENAPYK